MLYLCRKPERTFLHNATCCEKRNQVSLSTPLRFILPVEPLGQSAKVISVQHRCHPTTSNTHYAPIWPTLFSPPSCPQCVFYHSLHGHTWLSENLFPHILRSWGKWKQRKLPDLIDIIPERSHYHDCPLTFLLPSNYRRITFELFLNYL
jgi:hypothetical protein